MMEQFVTVYTFNYPHEAYVIKGRLESEGIEVFLKDENTVQAYNFLSNAVGGVKLQVRESDVMEAMKIINETADQNISVEEVFENGDQEQFQPANKNIILCPNCNSENVSETIRPNWVFAISIFLLGFPLIFIRRRYHCFNCGQEFYRKRNKQ